jgi:hypothetical protein
MASTKRAADFTGKQAEKLAAQHAEEQAARAASVAMVTAAAVKADQEPVDYSAGPTQVVADDGETVIEVKQSNVKIRVNTTLEQLTFGKDNHYDFEEGREYVVPQALADHLEEKGLLWH